MTTEQEKEFSQIVERAGKFVDDNSELLKSVKDLAGVEGGLAVIRKLPELLKQQGTDIETLRNQLTEARRILSARQQPGGPRQKGRLSNEAAAQLGAHFVLCLQRQNKLESVVPEAALRTSLLAETRSIFGQTDKTLSTSDIPLPTQYFSEIRDLIAEYGVARRVMTPWPLSGGTDKPPRGKTRFALTTIASAAQFGSKSVQIEFAALESHKFGGIIYTPREIREQSIVALGQYIARLAAVAAAQIEDETAFLADASATYESIQGVSYVAVANSKVRYLGNSNTSGKTKPSDIVVADLRAVFALVNSRVRSTGQWYMNNTWEAYLPEFNTDANQYTFRYNAAGQALLFGRPITWVEVLQEYSESAQAAKDVALFGDLSYWWMGTRSGGLRIDESSDFKFDYDLIATRLIEEIDFDYMATDAVATVKTPAS